MTSRERFKAWRTRDIEETREEYPWKRDYYVWQACEAQSAARIAQLEEENQHLKDLNEMLRAENISYRQRNSLGTTNHQGD